MWDFRWARRLYGPLTDRFGRKPPLYIGMLVYTLSSGACALPASVEALTALRLLQSLGACAGSVISRAMVRDLFPPEETRRVYSALILVMGVSPLLAPLFGAYMLLWFGWKAIFLSVMIVGAMATVGMYLAAARNAAFGAPLSFGYMFATYLDSAEGPLLPGRDAGHRIQLRGNVRLYRRIAVHLHQPLRSPSRPFQLVLRLNAAAVVIGAQVNGRMLHGHSPEKVMRWAAYVQAAAGVLLILAAVAGAKSLASIALPLFLYLCTIGFVFPNAVALALANHGQVAGMASALLGTLQFSMAGIATLALGAIDSTTTLPMSAIICFCGVMGVAMHLLLMRQISLPARASR